MTLDTPFEVVSPFFSDVISGLTQPEKSIDPKWLYDDVGSALFEEITQLPEYYLTRVETRMLQEHAEEICGLLPAGGALVEFGSGASVKTRTLLDAGPHIGTYVPIDISEAFLQETAQDLRQRYPDVSIQPVIGDFINPVTLPTNLNAVPKLGFFPGSTLGNIAPSAARRLLTRARAWPKVQGFVLGVDLVKEPHVLEAAYDDAAGVTRKFILNMLARINRDLGADFDLKKFRYEARWNSSQRQVEMSLVSSNKQTATIGNHAVFFQADERVMISKSRKYTADTIGTTARDSGWNVETLLTDDSNLFAIAVLKPIEAS